VAHEEAEILCVGKKLVSERNKNRAALVHTNG
jgi:hypothetical protein